MAKQNYYEALGVSRTADEAELKSAYRKLAMEHHPDRNGGSKESEARFKEISEAYAALSNADKRAAYDRFGNNFAGYSYTETATTSHEPDPFVQEVLDEIMREAKINVEKARKKKKEYKHILDGGMDFWTQVALGSTYTGVAGFAFELYEKIQLHGTTYLSIDGISSVINSLPYAFIGAVAGTHIDRFRDAHRAATNPQYLQLTGTVAEAGVKDLLAATIALSLAFTALGVKLNLYKPEIPSDLATASFSENARRPTPFSASSLAVISPPR